MIRQRKFILGLALLLLPCMALAQECKFDLEQTDPNDGLMRVVGYDIGAKSWNWKFFMEQIGPKYFVTVRITRAGKEEGVFTKGQKIAVELENKEKLELVAASDFGPNYYPDVPDSNGCSIYIPRFEVSKDFLASLSKSRIRHLKTVVNSKKLSLPDIAPEQSDKISRTSACLLKS
jgi:hypothetical protein